MMRWECENFLAFLDSACLVTYEKGVVYCLDEMGPLGPGCAWIFWRIQTYKHTCYAKLDYSPSVSTAGDVLHCGAMVPLVELLCPPGASREQLSPKQKMKLVLFWGCRQLATWLVALLFFTCGKSVDSNRGSLSTPCPLCCVVYSVHHTQSKWWWWILCCVFVFSSFARSQPRFPLIVSRLLVYLRCTTNTAICMSWCDFWLNNSRAIDHDCHDQPGRAIEHL